MIIPVPADPDHGVEAKSRTPLEPTSKVLTFPPVPKDPVPVPKLTKTFEFTVMFPVDAVRPFTVELAVKITFVLFVKPVVNGPPLELPQFESVQFPVTPLVFQ
ncbi:MAG: hypothetical protein ACKOHM_01350 [Spartobacteria bacterium]